MNIQKKEAFTLVELIVVITILAILGTIAFISFQGYSRSARNSRRISDVSNIKISLALFNTRTGRYPEPENFTNITYLGAMVRSEGIMGKTVVRQLKELPKVPLDPLLDVEYAYSLLNTKKEYEVGTIVEGQSGIIGYLDKKIISNIYADSNTNFAYIKGTYNGIVAKVSTGGTEYALAVPTIIGADLTDSNYENLVDNKLLSYDGFQNLPSSYSGTNLTMTGGFDFGGNSDNIVLYTGSIEDLSDSSSELKIFGDNLQTAYTGTDLSSLSQYSQILSMNTSDINELNSVAGNIVNNYLGGKVASASVSIFDATLTKTLASNAGSTAYEAGDVITITLNGITQTYTLSSADVANDDNVLLTSIKSAIDGNPSMSALVSTVVTDKNTLTLTSKNSGTTFTASAEITTDFSSDGVDIIISSALGSGTFTLGLSTIVQGGTTIISNTCSVAPTSYTSSNTSVATISGTTITGVGGGTTNITPVGGSCADVSAKVLTVETGSYTISDCASSGQVLQADTTYGSCDTANIIVCTGVGAGYTMSACNVGTNIAATAFDDSNGFGHHFQFGRNVSYEDGTWTNGLVGISYDWLSPGGTDNGSAVLWGVTDALGLTATYTNSSVANQALMQGPCLNGYHIPTNKEWVDVYTAGGWLEDGIAMSNDLKLPMAGRYNRADAVLTTSGTRANYWSSSSHNIFGYDMDFGSIFIGPDGTIIRANGLSIRCFKN